MPNNEQNKNQPAYEVFATREKADGNTMWFRIGAAYITRDGSINLDFVAIPTSGRCQLRERKADNDDRQRR